MTSILHKGKFVPKQPLIENTIETVSSLKSGFTREKNKTLVDCNPLMYILPAVTISLFFFSWVLYMHDTQQYYFLQCVFKIIDLDFHLSEWLKILMREADKEVWGTIAGALTRPLHGTQPAKYRLREWCYFISSPETVHHLASFDVHNIEGLEDW